MGTGSRKTWLERQTDKVQIRVLSMDREGRKLEEIAAAVNQEFNLKVPVSTLHNSIQEWGKRFDLEETLNLEMRRELDDICAQHPNADPRVLARGVIAHRLHEALKGELDPKTLLFAAQGEGNLKLRERELAAKEEANRLRKEQNDLEREHVELVRQKITAAAGGMDGRELYLQAAQDILKKLHTYQDLKPVLQARQEEIVAELAHSAEGFARKLEHEG